MTAKPWDLRVGDWRTALADVAMVDALIVDAPYSERTHNGHDAGIPSSSVAERGYREKQWHRADGRVEKAWSGERQTIDYASMAPADVQEFVASWHPRCRGWFVSITDHDLWPAWRDALEAAGRYVFSPIPLVETGGRVRLSGDGPSSWTCWLCVARPRREPWSSWGTLPGAYVQGAERKPIVVGKPLSAMRAIIRDYTRPGDLVCDPLAGAGTTLIAACKEGRRGVGAELDPTTALRAVKRLLHADLSPPLFPDVPRGRAEQLPLDAAITPLDAAQAVV